MKKSNLLFWVTLALAVHAGLAGTLAAADGDKAGNGDNEQLETIANLLADKDKDMRALGLQQVRDAAKGPAATRRFAALLAKLQPEAQAGLLDALADRGDARARGAVLEMLASPAEEVRAAALRAVGSLGTAADVPRLVETLAKPPGAEPSAAKASLVRLRGQAVSRTIAAEMGQASSSLRIELIGVLAARRATDALPSILAAAVDADTGVRMAAMDTAAKLAEPKQAAAMLPGVLKADRGAEREAAERAVTRVCGAVKDPDHRADPLLAAWDKLGADDRTTLLPLLGRLGGPGARKIVEAALADRDPRRREAGFRALCNWPDVSVVPRLLDLIQTEGNLEHRSAALRAVIRVAALPDKRSNAERLDLLKQAMKLATRDEERRYVLARAATVRTMESLRFVAPHMDKPALAQQAAASVVGLAHYRDLRIPNQAEFNPLLDKAIRISKDPKVIDQAQRYKAGRT